MATFGDHRYAYVTLMTRASYLAGVIILAHTLKTCGSSYPLVVLYTPNLADHAVRALELEASKSNIIPRRCEYLLPPENITVQLIAQRFEDTWTKLRVFELFDYDAVCYLDADMAIFRNMDGVFEFAPKLPPNFIAANHPCVCNPEADPWAPEEWCAKNCPYTLLSHPKALTAHPQPSDDPRRTYQLLNGGMFLFHPSRELWDDMLEVFNTTPLLSTFKFPDQDFLAHYFKSRRIALGWQYNAFKTMRYRHPNVWRDQEVICLHYIVDKPWVKRIGPDGTAGYKGNDGVTHQWWWDAYQRWETERSNGTEDGLEAVELVSRGVAKPPGEIDGYDEDEDMRAIGSQVQAFAKGVPVKPNKSDN